MKTKSEGRCAYCGEVTTKDVLRHRLGLCEGCYTTMRMKGQSIPVTAKEFVRYAWDVIKNNPCSCYYLHDWGCNIGLWDVEVDRETMRQAGRLNERHERFCDYIRETLPGWKVVDTVYYMDNSVEVVEESKDGRRRQRMTTAPHGDICF